MATQELTDADFQNLTPDVKPTSSPSPVSPELTDADFSGNTGATVTAPSAPQSTTYVEDKNTVVGHPADMSHDQVNDAIQTQIYNRPRVNFHLDAPPLDSNLASALARGYTNIDPTLRMTKALVENGPEVGKAAIRGVEDAGRGVAGLVKWIGESLQHGEGAGVVAEPEFVQAVGRHMASMSQDVTDYLKKRESAGFEAPDPELFRGSFVSNPSVLRVIAGVVQGLPTLAAASAITAATGNPLAGAAALGAVGAGEQYETSRERGAPVSQASEAATLSGIGNTVMMSLPLSHYLEGFGGEGIGTIARGVTEGAALNVAMNPFNNIVAKIGGDKARKLFDGFAESTISMAATMGILAGFSPGRGAEIDSLVQDAHKAGVSAKDIDAARAEIGKQITENPGAVTDALEKEKFSRTGNDELAQAAQATKESPDLKAGSDLVYNDIKTKLSALERPEGISEEAWQSQIDKGAQLWAAHAVTEAQKRGVTVEDVYRGMRPQILNQEPGEVSPAPGTVFQDQTEPQPIAASHPDQSVENAKARDIYFPPSEITSKESIASHPDFNKISDDATAIVDHYAKQRGIEPSPQFPRKLWGEMHDALGEIMKAEPADRPEVVAGVKKKFPDIQNEFTTLRDKLYTDVTDNWFERNVAGKYGQANRAKVAIDAEKNASRETIYPTEKRPPQTQAPAFKIWFGESKVVDENGQPKTVYHSTTNPDQLREFEKRGGLAGNFGTLEAAQDRMRQAREDGTFNEEAPASIVPVYLSIKNPVEMTDVHFDEASTMADDLVERGIITPTEADSVGAYKSGANRKGIEGLVKILKKKGYDGIVYANKIEDPGSQSYIPFEPTQIKSTISNQGTFDPNNPNILYQSQPKAPTFYSKLANVVDEKMPAKASGDQVEGLLKNAGVKQDEADWMGLPEFLKSKKSVTKAELQEFIRENNVKVQEVVKGGMVGLSPEEQKRYSELKEQVTNGTGLDSDESDEYDDFQSRMELPSATKFSQYTLPGGENYRELLLTLPEPPPTAGEQFGALNRRIINRLGRTNFSVDELTPDERSENERIKSLPEPVEPFRSSHFSEPNILAHIRFNDRVDAEGKKTLFVEEVQSDWHQKGREKGYAGENSEQLKMNKERYDKVSTEALELSAQRAKIATDKSLSDGEARRRLAPIDARRDALFREINWLNMERREIEGGVPNAPFKKTWHELALKRMLRYAAENGYDKVAWTTGEQQAERYNLANQVDEIEALRNADGTYSILATPKDSDGTVNVGKNISENELADRVGKDLAAKIVKQSAEEQTYSGLDLKVGGEGMKGFYDQIIPSFLNKYTKKWGGKVDEATIRASERMFTGFKYTGPTYTIDELKTGLIEMRKSRGWYDRTSPFTGEKIETSIGNVSKVQTVSSVIKGMSDGLSFQEAIEQRGSPEAAELFGGSMDNVETEQGGLVKVHSLDITPAMKDSVMQEGQPLFQGEPNAPRGSAEFSPEGAVIRLMKNADASTFVHESAHVWLKDIHDYVLSGKADERYLGDWNTLSNWLGVKEGATDLTREQHEQFAKGFEAYLREGKAPSPGLLGVFQRFKEWLTQVYKSAKVLNVNLTDDVRGVMDRMLASPDQENKYVLNRPFQVEFGKTDKDTGARLREEFAGIKNEQIVHGNQFAEDIERAIPEKERQGIFWYNEARGDRDLLVEKLNDPDLAKYHDQIEAALNLSPAALREAKNVRDYFEEAGHVSQDIGTLKNLRENYQNRIYEPRPPSDYVQTEMNKGLKQTTSHAKERVFDTAFDAAGFRSEKYPEGMKFATTDIAKLVRIHNEEMAWVNTSRKMANAMIDQGLIGAWSKEVPEGWAPVGKMQKKAAVLDKDGEPVIDENGEPVTSDQNFIAPEGIAKALKAISDPDFAKKIGILRLAQKYQGVEKTLNLSFSFFHHLTFLNKIITNGGIRALMNIRTMNEQFASPEFKEMERDFVANGIGEISTVHTNQDILRNLVDNSGDTFSKITNLPVVKQMLQGAEKGGNFLFDKVQRYLKVTNYGAKMSDWVANNPDATNAEVKAAKQGFAQEINNIYGGQNWEAMGMTKSNLTLLRLIFLAPDYGISNLRYLRGLVRSGTEGSATRSDFAVSMIGGMILTEGINKMLTGHFTDKNKTGHKLEIEIAPDVYISLIRGAPGEVNKMVSNVAESGPKGAFRYAAGKLAAFPRTALGLATGVQYGSRSIYQPHDKHPIIGNTYDALKFVLMNNTNVPFSASALADYLKNERTRTPAGLVAVGTGIGRFTKQGSQSSSLKL